LWSAEKNKTMQKNIIKNKMQLLNVFPVALFAFGGRALTVGRGSPIDGIAASVLALAVMPAAAWASGFLPAVEGLREKKSIGGKMFYAIFVSFAAVAAFCIAAVSVKEFSAFASEVMFVRIPLWGVTAIFLGFCACLSAGGRDVIRKFSFASFLIVSAVVPILFFLSLPNFDTTDVSGLLKFRGISAGGVASSIGGIFAPAVIAVIYLSATGRHGQDRVKASEAALAVLLAALLLLVCFLNVNLLLGEYFGSTRDYPYSEAVSTVTAGKLFARMEGLAYVMYYAVSAVKISVSVAFICLLVNVLIPKAWRDKRIMKRLPYAVAVIVGVLSAVL
jgi:hypothetical protein